MTDSPHDQSSNHTPLCHLARTMFSEMDRRYEQKFAAVEEAIEKAERAMEIRLESMNQFRAQILSERNAFATRRETAFITFISSVIVVVIASVLAYILRK